MKNHKGEGEGLNKVMKKDQIVSAYTQMHEYFDKS